MGKAFAHEKGLAEYEDEFAKGAVVAQDPLVFESLDILNDEDKRVLRREVTHKASRRLVPHVERWSLTPFVSQWDHPKQLVRVFSPRLSVLGDWS